MKLGFYIILAAQFVSALADNALLFAAIALLKEFNAPDWHTPLLQEFFVIAYILLAPFVGRRAGRPCRWHDDRRGRVGLPWCRRADRVLGRRSSGS